MRSFRDAAQNKVPAHTTISAQALIQQAGLPRPASLLALMQNLDPDPNALNFHQDIVTPEGTPLGGWVDLHLHSNGDYQVVFHMHSSSIAGNFDFDLRGYLSAANCPTFFFHHSGHVSGIDSADYPESGTNPLIAIYWSQLKRSGNFTAAKDYQWGGAVGTLDRLADDLIHLRLLDFGAGVVGTALGAVIALTQEAISWIDANLGPGGTLAVISGVAVFAAAAALGAGAGTALIFGTVAGVAVGAVTNALINWRHLAQSEIDLARTVFGNTIPYDKVVESVALV